MVMPRLRFQMNKPSPSDRQQSDQARKKARATVRKVHLRLASGSALNRKKYVDPESGTEFTSKKAMVAAQRNRAAQVLNEFDRLVRDKTLGQDPWEQLPGESDLQYSRFRAYIHQPKEKMRRSVPRLADTLSLRRETIGDLAQKYHWSLRADCWDKDQMALEDEEFRAARRTAIRRQARLGEKLQTLAERGANNFILTGAIDLTPNDVARLADIGVKTERLAFGDSTSNEARHQETRVVWDGPTPPWAKSSTAIESPVIDGEVPDGQ